MALIHRLGVLCHSGQARLYDIQLLGIIVFVKREDRVFFLQTVGVGLCKVRLIGGHDGPDQRQKLFAADGFVKVVVKRDVKGRGMEVGDGCLPIGSEVQQGFVVRYLPGHVVGIYAPRHQALLELFNGVLVRHRSLLQGGGQYLFPGDIRDVEGDSVGGDAVSGAVEGEYNGGARRCRAGFAEEQERCESKSDNGANHKDDDARPEPMRLL